MAGHPADVAGAGELEFFRCELAQDLAFSLEHHPVSVAGRAAMLIQRGSDEEVDDGVDRQKNERSLHASR